MLQADGSQAGQFCLGRRRSAICDDRRALLAIRKTVEDQGAKSVVVPIVVRVGVVADRWTGVVLIVVPRTAPHTQVLRPVPLFHLLQPGVPFCALRFSGGHDRILEIQGPALDALG